MYKTKTKFKFLALTLAICYIAAMLDPSLSAQNNLPYQTPPKGIVDLIDAPQTPSSSLSPSGKWMALINRPNLPGIDEVSQEELRLAGIRINPQTNGSSRAFYYNGIKLKSLETMEEIEVQGLPENPKIENLSWSPDGLKMAFTITVSEGIQLWVLNLETAMAKKYTDDIINDAMSGIPFKWLSDNKRILYKSIVTERGNAPTAAKQPKGPVIQENIGKAAPVRTYQDLLKNPTDEAKFEYYTNAQLFLLDTESGSSTSFAKAGIIKGFSTSPDAKYVMVMTIVRPFSYIVPNSRFPFTVDIYDTSGKLVTTIAKIPSAENIPKGFGAVRTGPRSFNWRADKPATIYWVEAQDGGDPKAKAAIRDKLYMLEAPFTSKPQESIHFNLRYGGIDWGSDDLAISYEWWWQNRQLITAKWDPSDTQAAKAVLYDRSWEDSYNDPGEFATERNIYGRNVLLTSKGQSTLWLTGLGASPEGNRPFVDQYDLESGKTKRLWRSEAPYYERASEIIDPEKGIVLTRRESTDEPPNYYLRNLNNSELTQITHFENPYKALQDVKKELIKYKRADGVELTGTLYLPPGYDKERDGKLPVFMWAYPREFKSADAAGQVKDSPYEFIRLGWWSPLPWVTQGYAVLDDFGMPIIGEGEEEPNETFVEQLRSGAQAAADKLESMGVADIDRLVVGGHSYGAFMTANLLAHTDIFAAGIARSGAYNRTLTPFGFQSEERTFWEAPETYFKMSPFMHADKIKEPLLLIHGEADNNSGTYPMQSERFYAALKGHGATTRLVMLPHESHGYRARESIMHMLWEMNQWTETYVKKKKMEAIKEP